MAVFSSKTGVAVLTSTVALGGALFSRRDSTDADLSQSSSGVSAGEGKSLVTKSVFLASEAADLGQIRESEGAADIAESFTKRTGLELSREDRLLLQSADKRIHEKHISAVLDSSKTLAEAGDIDGFDAAIRQIRQQAHKWKITLNTEQEDMLTRSFKTSREKSISPALERAVEAACKGEVERCNYAITQVRTSVEEGNLTLTSQQEAALAEAYKTARVNAITPKINEALKAAEEGRLRESEFAVSDLERYASEAKISLSKEQEALLTRVREEQKNRPPVTNPAPRQSGKADVRMV